MRKIRFSRQWKILNGILFFIIPISLFAQKKETYSLHGKITGLKENEKVTMQLVVGTDFKFENRDSGYVKNGEFSIIGSVPEGPRTYWINFDKHPSQCVILFIDNGENIFINCLKDIGTIHHSYLQHFMTIDGSPSNYAMNCLVPILTQYRQARGAIHRYLDKIQDSLGFNPTIIDPVLTLKNTLKGNLYHSFFENIEPDYIKAVPVLAEEALIDATDRAWYWKNVYDSLDDYQKNTYSGRRLKEKVALCIGQPFPCFTLPTPEGQLLELKKVVTENKLTIVQFWSSNSYQVDKYQEELLLIFKKYKSKGINIIGVSSDTVLNKWKAGILRNDIPWSQVSDLKGANGIVAKIYHEYGDSKMPNTTNVIIDENGKILAWDISGWELQWFLWKRFDANIPKAVVNK
ncbi:Peroxiredoxin [Chitinophaga sp. YR573]|uniref:redoxin domain-containing protein n=1 Tax=Chitinophaga sp. YR573 TaxID=1881040 RepID=UPI0008BB437D|nr:redoxin domain-containing protein [Chitinophaga sp. YR573]SEW04706.1 Peroxiredoxin [Chitinophaga sp. YR573]